MDGAEEEMRDGMERARRYAGFFDWPLNRDVAEFGVVESLAKSLKISGNLFFKNLSIRGRGSDPPDLEAMDFNDLRIAIEVTELVDGQAIHLYKQGFTGVYSLWGRDRFLNRLNEILAVKHACYDNLKDGPYGGGYIVVIHTDEIDLTHIAVQEYLSNAVFPGYPYIKKAFLILSYFPGIGYPLFELNLV